MKLFRSNIKLFGSIPTWMKFETNGCALSLSFPTADSGVTEEGIRTFDLTVGRGWTPHSRLVTGASSAHGRGTLRNACFATTVASGSDPADMHGFYARGRGPLRMLYEAESPVSVAEHARQK